MSTRDYQMTSLRAHQTCVLRARPACFRPSGACVPQGNLSFRAGGACVGVAACVGGAQESAYVTGSPGVSYEQSTLGLIQPHFTSLEKLRPRDLILVEMIMSNCNKER